MGETRPLISIGMPVRNCAATLPLAIRSLLAQTYTHRELWLIDDGSTDNTVAVARGFADPRIRVLADGAARGLPARLNEAVARSEGPLFARMDGDDVAYPRRLERQLGYLQRPADIDLVGAQAIVFGDGGALLGKRPCREDHALICARPASGFALIHPTFLGRTDFFRRFRYRPSAVRCEDQDLLLRAYRSSRFANAPEILLGYRESHLEREKILTSRRFFARSLFREFWQQGRPQIAVRAAAEQGLKALADDIAMRTGLTRQLLRHRARPVTPDERRSWEEVWAGLDDAGAVASYGAARSWAATA